MLAVDTIITLELGHYRLREQIASSAYGVVWRASGPRGTRDVALKLVNQEQMARAQPEQQVRWCISAHNEIAFLQSLEPWDERHIVRLLDSGQHQGLPVLALELIPCDLGQHVRALGDGRAPPLAQVLDWVAQLNQALAKVHQYGWRYLDLKPANVLLDVHRNRVKLADFGTNLPLAELAPHPYAGTANWQAPEQFFPTPQGGYATAARSDYFALGALFYYLVAGGTTLRFGASCGRAMRDHQSGAAALLRRRYGGALPPTLDNAEEVLFLQKIDQGLAAAGGGHRPTSAGACHDAALALLRRLLAPAPGDRPGHAVEISRMLATITACLPVRGTP